MGKIHVIFYQGAHVGPEDALLLRPHLANCDLLCPEGTVPISQVQKLESIYNSEEISHYIERIAKGNRNRLGKPFSFPSYTIALCRIIQQHRIKVKFMEVCDDETFERLEQLDHSTLSLEEEAVHLFLSGRFNKSLEKKKRAIKEMADSTFIRDERIVSNLKGVVENLFRSYPEFEGKQRVKIVCTLGANHLQPVRELRKQFAHDSQIDIAKRFPLAYYPLPYTSRCVRRVLLSIEKKRTEANADYARAVLEMVFKVAFEEYRTVWTSSTRSILLTLPVLSRLSLRDIRLLSTMFASHPSGPDVIREYLHQKGIDFPAPGEDVDRFIRTRILVSPPWERLLPSRAATQKQSV